MGRKLAAALVLLAASRLPFIQHEGKRVAVEDMRSLHFQSSVAAILSRLKLEVLRHRVNQTSLEARETTTAFWGTRNLQTGTSAESTSQLAAADETPREKHGESTAASQGLSQSGEDRAGPDWLQRLGFNASERGAEKDEELADIILRHLGFQQRKEKPPEPRATADKEGGSKEDMSNEITTSELFAIDSDGDGRLEPTLEAGEGEGKSEGGKLDLVKEGYATLKEKVGLQIFQDIADPVIGLYKRAIAKGSELETVANLRMLADIASSMQATTAGMDPWSLSDLTLGLYLLSLKHAAEGVQDTIPGEVVKDRGEVEDLLYHLELARGAYAQDAAGLARVCMLRECRVAKFEAKATILRPAYYIAADDRRRLIVLGIRGTTQAHDLFTDLATAGEEFLDGGYAHAGILHAAKWFVKNEAPMLKKLLQQNPGYALRLVGHSLGGGTAAVVTILLRDQPGLVGLPPENIFAVCFSPPACLSRSLANRTSKFVRTLVMQDDAIPRASARAMDRLRREVERTDWNMVGPGESLASLKGVASRHLESLQPTLQKLQAVAMDYAPAVLASKLKSESPPAEETQPGTENRGSVSEERLKQVGEAESREGRTGADDRQVGESGRAGESVRAEGAGERNVGTGDNEAASKGSGDTDAARQGCSGGSGQAGRGTDERTVNGEAETASGTDRSERNPSRGPDEELFAPGRLYHLVYKEKKSSRDSQDDESEPSPRVYRMIRGTETARFSRIVLSKSMLVDHAGREVYWGLRELLKVMP